MKNRVVVHQEIVIGIPVFSRDHSSVGSARIMKIAIAMDEHNFGKIFFDSLRRSVLRAVVNYEDPKIDAGPIDPGQTAKRLERCFATIINRNNSCDSDRSIVEFLFGWRSGRLSGHFYAVRTAEDRAGSDPRVRSTSFSIHA